jgi:hypothetical protein
MRRRLGKVVLLLILLMVVCSPFLQFQTLDGFPVTTDDFEQVVTCILCEVGMLLLFLGIMKLLPVLLRIRFLVRVPRFAVCEIDDLGPQSCLLCLSPPLRN